MKCSTILVCLSAAALGVPLCAQADQDFHGIVESRPQGPGGTWVIGGRHIEVTQPIIINEGAGPLVVGGCVSVDYEDGMIAEIDTEPASRCEQAGAR